MWWRCSCQKIKFLSDMAYSTVLLDGCIWGPGILDDCKNPCMISWLWCLTWKKKQKVIISKVVKNPVVSNMITRSVNSSTLVFNHPSLQLSSKTLPYISKSLKKTILSCLNSLCIFKYIAYKDHQKRSYTCFKIHFIQVNKAVKMVIAEHCHISHSPSKYVLLQRTFATLGRSKEML